MRPLTAAQRQLVARARAKAHLLYEGLHTPHRSCGICLAETFNLPSRSYQALRRGGITGDGECGAIKAGELVLGELLGDPSPTGAVTEALRAAITDYRREWQARIPHEDGIACNALVRVFPSFQAPERAAYCTTLAAAVAELVAQVLLAHGGSLDITPIAGLPVELQP